MLSEKNRKLMAQISKKEKSNVLFAHVKQKQVEKEKSTLTLKPESQQNLYLKKPSKFID